MEFLDSLEIVQRHRYLLTVCVDWNTEATILLECSEKWEFASSQEDWKVSELSKILPNHIEGNVGIAHTRWATHGGVTDENAHPHLSQNGDIALVHNGIIDNARGLRKLLTERGFHLESETDSEALVHMISIGMIQVRSPLESVRETLNRVTGTWGLCVLFKEHDLIVVQEMAHL